MKHAIKEMLLEEKKEQVLYEAKMEEKNLPYVPDAHYNLGYVYEICNKLMEAYEQYSIAQKLVEGGNSGKFHDEDIEKHKADILSQIADELEIGTKEQLMAKKKFLDYIIIQDDLMWEVQNPVFQNRTAIIGREYVDYSDLPKMFLGIKGLQSAFENVFSTMEKNTVVNKTEIQRTSEEGKTIKIDLNEESFVPIIMEQKGILTFQTENNKKDVLYSSPLQWVEYRVPKGYICITSNEAPFRIGEIVPIKHDKKRKRLVLNIFVDGLSQTVLDENFEQLMPHTYQFFKKGMVCENVYTAGDWTFPSVASIITGQTIAKHKMLHSKLLRRLDIDTPILFEYFKNAGYNTTKIGGNWRIAPNYGYARGMNRVFYHHMYEGYSAERVIADVEEQMHQMRDTDQFIWMELGELHLIADELNMAPLQSEFMVWENEALNKKVNSVKQEYDETKKKYYSKQIEYLDRRLAGLYQYIEENYKEDEIIVSMFADHGQGYLVKPDEKFLSDGRTKVAFMFRGNSLNGKSDEIISTCDYASVMCKLAGIDYNYTNTDAHLPVVFGGREERKFSVTESIHVGDPYQIILNGKDYCFYLKGKDKVTSECRVPLGEYEVQLFDCCGNEVKDEKKISYYTQWCIEHLKLCGIVVL